MKTTKKLNRLMLVLPLSLMTTGIMAETSTNATAANSGTIALMIVLASAVVLAIMNLKHSIKHLYTNLFAKRK